MSSSCDPMDCSLQAPLRLLGWLVSKNTREKVLLRMWKNGDPEHWLWRGCEKNLAFFWVSFCPWFSLLVTSGKISNEQRVLLLGKETPRGCMEWSGVFSKCGRGFVSPDEGQRAAGPGENRRWEKVPAPNRSSSRPDKKMETKPRPSEDTSQES